MIESNGDNVNPSAVNPIDGARIYYETSPSEESGGSGGSGKSVILLHHEFTRPVEEWKPDYADALADNYLLVFMDARAHGQSDKPHDAALHAMENRVCAGQTTVPYPNPIGPNF
jgi:pimeloyl-ACP methyl ester carboxylesterase